VHIRWLREKIEDDSAAPIYIETVRGHGYRFADPTAPGAPDAAA
jgi:DNA-binding response OmpR family regulator